MFWPRQEVFVFYEASQVPREASVSRPCSIILCEFTQNSGHETGLPQCTLKGPHGARPNVHGRKGEAQMCPRIRARSRSQRELVARRHHQVGRPATTSGAGAPRSAPPRRSRSALGHAAAARSRAFSAATSRLVEPQPPAPRRRPRALCPPLASARWSTACCSRSEATATADATS